MGSKETMDHHKTDLVAADGTKQWHSRFGYIMVAAGAAIGLGNIWKFPYLAYQGGGGIFLIVYIIIVAVMAHPMVMMETAVGRYGGGDAVTCFDKIKNGWGCIGWIANLCTLMINMFYVVVGGWVLRYAVQFIISGDFGEDVDEFYNGLISSNMVPIIFAFIVLAITSVLLVFGITGIVEKVASVIMPALVVLLVFCAIYGSVSTPGALSGLKYYLIPNPADFSFKVFAQAATQVLFSVGIGWGIFTTLGTNVAKSNSIRSDSLMISICDTGVAILAGFVVIPIAFGAGVDLQSGPKLLFSVMAGIFGKLPGGRLIGAVFFIAVMFAVFSSLFTFFEISMRTFEVKLKLGRVKAVITVSAIIFIGNILVSLDFGAISAFKLPWPSFAGVEMYNLFDWFDCFTGYVLLPLGCLLVCFFVARVWGFTNYENELNANGETKKLTTYNKVLTIAVIPIFMIIVLLYVFGFIR